MSPRTLLCLTATALLGACAASPVPVVGIPGPNKTVATFQQDEQACRTAASQAAHASPAPQADPAATESAPPNGGWQQFFTSYAQCQTAHGNYVQPVPWVIAYATYLGHAAPYPMAYPPPYPPPPYPYPYAPYPYPYGYP
jgi:hypothetical protein